MKVGDLVKVKTCTKLDKMHPFHGVCKCFFCSGNSNRIGVVLGPAPRNNWHIMFDCGTWILDDFDEARGDVEVINESW